MSVSVEQLHKDGVTVTAVAYTLLGHTMFYGESHLLEDQFHVNLITLRHIYRPFPLRSVHFSVIIPFCPPFLYLKLKPLGRRSKGIRGVMNKLLFALMLLSFLMATS